MISTATSRVLQGENAQKEQKRTRGMISAKNTGAHPNAFKASATASGVARCPPNTPRPTMV